MEIMYDSAHVTAMLEKGNQCSVHMNIEHMSICDTKNVAPATCIDDP